MKNTLKFIFKWGFVPLIFLVSLIYLRYLYVDYVEMTSHEKKQVGVYVFDTQKTDMGSYQKDSKKYKGLYLNIYENGKFKFNNSVPFIYKNQGYWEAHGVGLEWNKIFFNEKGPYIELSQCCNLDSTILINGLIPQDGNDNIQEMYFKKINPSKDNLN